MRRARALVYTFIFAAGAGALWWLAHRGNPAPAPDGDLSAASPPETGAFAPGEPPRPHEPRPPTTERPALAWERLLAADGSPGEDLAALGDLVAGYLHSGLGEARRGIGFNEDLVPALTDAAALGEAALPAGHPAIRAGRLIDRWGTPWQVHPLARDAIQIRSAGPDRRLYTRDDLVAPPDGARD
jgi:hypothetical protein